MKLTNGIAVYEQKRNGLFNVIANFRNKGAEIVFQSYNKSDVIRYCHEHGMKAVSMDVYNRNVNASFRKVNAKHKFNPAEWLLGIVC